MNLHKLTSHHLTHTGATSRARIYHTARAREKKILGHKFSSCHTLSSLSSTRPQLVFSLISSHLLFFQLFPLLLSSSSVFYLLLSQLVLHSPLSLASSRLPSLDHHHLSSVHPQAPSPKLFRHLPSSLCNTTYSSSTILLLRLILSSPLIRSSVIFLICINFHSPQAVLSLPVPICFLVLHLPSAPLYLHSILSLSSSILVHLPFFLWIPL